MALVSLGGEEFIGAKEEEFKTERDGLQVFKVAGIEAKTNDHGTFIEMYFEVSRGPNAGVYAELTEKFGKPEFPWLKYFTIGFKISGKNGMTRLKGLLTKIGEDPANAKVGPAIISTMNATGSIDDQLLLGAEVGIKTVWKKNDNGYYNLDTDGYKAWTTVAEAEAAKPGKEKPKAEVTASDFGGDDEEDWA